LPNGAYIFIPKKSKIGFTFEGVGMENIVILNGHVMPFGMYIVRQYGMHAGRSKQPKIVALDPFYMVGLTLLIKIQKLHFQHKSK
jgi:hypothetical protein